MNNLIGQKIEQYLVESFIGKGKSGVVYRARDLNLERSVTLKIIAPELAIHPAIRQRLMQAARGISRLTQPSIVTLYNFGTIHGRFYLVMDYVNGVSLGKLLSSLTARRQIMPLKDTLHLMSQVAEALGFAHQAGTLHLNLKSSNILIKQLERPGRYGDPARRAMLTDFGAALIPESGLQTAFIDLSDNFPYLSPEQCTNGRLDGRADIYSMGIILYQLLCGQVPFDITTPTEAIMRHAIEIPIPLREVRPSVPPDIAHIVHKALEKDPANRFQLAEQLADVLQQAFQSQMVIKAAKTKIISAVNQTTSAPNRPTPKPSKPTRHLTDRLMPPGTYPLFPGESAVSKRTDTSSALSTDVPPTPQPSLPTPQPSPVAPTPPPVPSQSIPPFHPNNLALSETMSVQPQFDTPIFDFEDALRPADPVPVAKPLPSEPRIFEQPDNISTKPEIEVVVHQETPPISVPVPTPAPFRPMTAVPQPAVEYEMPTEVHDLVESAVSIVILCQGQKPRRISLNRPRIRIGRSKENDIVLNSHDVSRHHALLEKTAKGWLLADLNSSAGTFWQGRKLLPKQPEIWYPEHTLQIGPYFLHWEPEDEADLDAFMVEEEMKTELFQVPDSARQVQSANGRFSVAMYPSLLALATGDEETINIELFNQGIGLDTLKLAVTGLPAGTYTLTQHFVTLSLGARASIPLVIQMPAAGTLISYRIPADNYPFEVIIHSKLFERETAVINGMLMVKPRERFSVSVWPSQVEDRQNVKILIRNEGNVQNSYSLVGRDKEGMIKFGGQRGRLLLKPGETLTQVIALRSRERPLLGREKEIPFEIEVQTENGRQQKKAGQLKVRPQIPDWALLIVELLLIILLGIFIVTNLLSRSQPIFQTPTPPQVTPASLPISGLELPDDSDQ
ncbi:MAG: protein kinase [Chloroflexi bacterium]|nr:protein kinase [Chloroflexota bacterium]